MEEQGLSAIDRLRIFVSLVFAGLMTPKQLEVRAAAIEESTGSGSLRDVCRQIRAAHERHVSGGKPSPAFLGHIKTAVTGQHPEDYTSA